MSCEHDWVYRTDGYEEYCTPAICTKCGRYGCWCDASENVHLTDRGARHDDFMARGIPGNNHEIEKRKEKRVSDINIKDLTREQIEQLRDQCEKALEKPQRQWRDWDVVKYSSGNVYVRLGKDVWRCAMAVNRDFVNEHMPDMYFDVHPFLFNLADLLQNPIVVGLTEQEADILQEHFRGSSSYTGIRAKVNGALRRYRGQEEAK